MSNLHGGGLGAGGNVSAVTRLGLAEVFARGVVGLCGAGNGDGEIRRVYQDVSEETEL